VRAVQAAEVMVELNDGQQMLASNLLSHEVAVGDYVLVDRGLVIQAISAAEAEAILALYAEMVVQEHV
jgi:hydrogenase maturation factor